MTKPVSITRFAQFYWASWVLGIIISLATWSEKTRMVSSSPQLANATWFLPATFLIGFLITLALWYFVAQRASVVAKWIVVVFAAFAAFSALYTVILLFGGRLAATPWVLLTLVSSALNVAAAVMLFKPDARAWFGERADVVDPAPPVDPIV